MMRLTVACNGSPACVEVDGSGDDVVIVGSAVPMGLDPAGRIGDCRSWFPGDELRLRAPDGMGGRTRAAHVSGADR